MFLHHIFFLVFFPTKKKGERKKKEEKKIFGWKPEKPCMEQDQSIEWKKKKINLKVFFKT